MNTFILINSSELVKSFTDMSNRSKKLHFATKEKLLNAGIISIPGTHILEHEYLIWLEQKGIIKRRR